MQEIKNLLLKELGNGLKLRIDRVNTYDKGGLIHMCLWGAIYKGGKYRIVRTSKKYVKYTIKKFEQFLLKEYEKEKEKLRKARKRQEKARKKALKIV